MTARFLPTLAACMIFGAGSALAHSYQQRDISIGHIWGPPAEETLSIYGPLLNTGKEADALVAVASPDAKTAQFCKEENEKQTCVESLALEPGKPLSLAPWSWHIRLSGLQKSVKKGSSLPLTLTFRRAGTVHVRVDIEEQPSSH